MPVLEPPWNKNCEGKVYGFDENGAQRLCKFDVDKIRVQARSNRVGFVDGWGDGESSGERRCSRRENHDIQKKKETPVDKAYREIISEDIDVVNKTIDDFKADYENHVHFTTNPDGYQKLGKIASESCMVFPCVRQDVLIAEHYNWECSAEMINHVYMSQSRPFSSQIVEDSFNVMKNTKGPFANKNAPVESSFHAIIHSDVQDVRHKHSKVEPNSALLRRNLRLGDTVFRAKWSEVPKFMFALSTYGQKPPYFSPGAADISSQYAHLELMKFTREFQCTNVAHCAWLGELCKVCVGEVC